MPQLGASLVKATTKSYETFIIQASCLIATYDHQNFKYRPLRYSKIIGLPLSETFLVNHSVASVINIFQP